MFQPISFWKQSKTLHNIEGKAASRQSISLLGDILKKSRTPVLYSGFSHILEPSKVSVVRVAYGLLGYTYLRPKLGEMVKKKNL